MATKKHKRRKTFFGNRSVPYEGRGADTRLCGTGRVVSARALRAVEAHGQELLCPCHTHAAAFARVFMGD